jgi:hypothetical protein
VPEFAEPTSVKHRDLEKKSLAGRMEISNLFPLARLKVGAENRLL